MSPPIVSGRCYRIDTDPSRLDIAFIHDFLTRGIPEGVVRRAVGHSLSFGLYCDEQQIGFARIVTDHATFAYLTDVFVVAEERHAGLGQWLIRVILAHPPLQGLRRWILATKKREASLSAIRLYRVVSRSLLSGAVRSRDLRVTGGMG